jgi:Papain family cysteine protease
MVRLQLPSMANQQLYLYHKFTRTMKKFVFLKLIIFLAVFLSLEGCQTTVEVELSPDQILKNRIQGLSRTPNDILSKVKIADKKVFNGSIPASCTINMPPIEPTGQGAEGSCVAWATAYTTCSFYEGGNFTNSNGSINYSSVFSPEYVYNQIKISSNCEKGSYFVTTNGKLGALDLLVQQGVCKWKDMPYTDTGCAIQPNSTQKTLASAYKITKYEQVQGFSTLELKKLLLTKSPLIIGATVDEGFVNANKTYIWNKQVGKDLGGHAIVIIGYDDSKNAFRIQNSWGNSWGDSGYTWLDYKYYYEVVFEAFIIYAN